MLSGRGLVKTFGKVVGLDGVDVDLFPGEVLAVIGDNGAGKSTLIKGLTGALIPDSGQVFLDGKEVHFRSPQDARQAGIETVYQTLAVAPALDIAANMFLGRERRARPPGLGAPDARQEGDEGGRRHVDGQPGHRHRAEHVPGGGDAVRGQRQAVAVARAATFAEKFVVLDEPTAALGVKETGQVLNLIQQIKAKGMPVILISHNMPNVFEVSDRIHIARLGGARRRDHPEDPHPNRGGGHHDRRHHAEERLKPDSPRTERGRSPAIMDSQIAGSDKC